MIVVNLCGGPGSGKSVGSAFIFSKLKMLGYNAELVAEFAKDKVYEENWTAIKNQAYIFGEQYHRIYRLQDKVDIIITDSPIILTIYYNQNPVLDDSFYDTVVKVHNSFESLNYLLKRVHPYKQEGRYQNEEQADEVAEKIAEIMQKYNLRYTTVDGATHGYEQIVWDILRLLEKYHPEIYIK